MAGTQSMSLKCLITSHDTETAISSVRLSASKALFTLNANMHTSGSNKKEDSSLHIECLLISPITKVHDQFNVIHVKNTDITFTVPERAFTQIILKPPCGQALPPIL